MLHYQFDSDEPQHLHVIWGWVHGFVQYRDLFDNHMPLFQIVLAPVVALNRRARHDSLLDALRFAADVRNCGLVHLPDWSTTFFATRRRLGCQALGTTAALGVPVLTASAGS